MTKYSNFPSKTLSIKEDTRKFLNRGLWERSFTYERMGKKALAKKDLEKIMSREPSYPGLNERLALLNS